MSKEEPALTKKEIDNMLFILNRSTGISNTVGRIRSYAKHIADYKNKKLGREDISQRKIINLILNNTTIMAHGIFKINPIMIKVLKSGKGKSGKTLGQMGDAYRKKQGGQPKVNRRRRR